MAENWSLQKRQQFSKLSPMAVVVIATSSPVAATVFCRDGETVRYAINNGLLAVRVTTSGMWRDGLSAAWNRNPFVETRVQFRVWTAGELLANRLEKRVLDHFRLMSEGSAMPPLHAGFVGIGPESDMAILEMEVHDLAKRQGIATFDDDGLSLFLDRRVRQHAHAVGADRHAYR